MNLEQLMDYHVLITLLYHHHSWHIDYYILLNCKLKCYSIVE